ncbi:MAG: hypothetical protein JNL72_07190 [Flavipsychrobacter sp.]|nr:hypothetical protein [Flavipsychrobacter sp.]
MKRLFLAAAVIVACKASAQGGKDASTWLQIKPGQTTQAQAEKLLGKPTGQMSKDEHASWRYAAGSNMVQMNWQNGELVECTVTDGTPAKQHWDPKQNQALNIGASVEDVVASLGMPRNMKIGRDVHLLQYQYEENVLHLSFKDGVLLRYEMNGWVSKK